MENVEGDVSDGQWETTLEFVLDIESFDGKDPTFDSVTVQPTADTTYALAAFGPGGSAQEVFTVTVSGS